MGSPAVFYASFLLRLWHTVSEAGPDQPRTHAEIEHIQTGERLSFGSLPELITFLQVQAAGSTNSPPDPIGQDPESSQNMRLNQ